MSMRAAGLLAVLALTACSHDRPAVAVEVAAPAEQAYLRYLAATLGLEDGLVAHLEAAVQSAKSDVAIAPQARSA